MGPGLRYGLISGEGEKQTVRRTMAALMALMMILLLAGCQSGEEELTVPAGTAVEVMTVERGDLFSESSVTGNVMANRNIPVMAPVAGEVESVSVKAGDTVEKGDVLFTMDTSDLRDTYGALLDSYSSTKTLLDEQVRQARQSLDNLKILYEMGAVSKNTLEQTERSVLQAETSRETTLAQLGADDVLDTLNDPDVTSPISGTVTSVAVTAGSMTSNTSVAVVVSEIGKPQAVVNVSETLRPSIHVGDEVQVTIPALQDTTVTGTVASAATAVSQETALYQVNIDLPEDLEVTVGMFATVVFRTDARYDAVLIPTETILTEDDVQYVYVVSGDTAIRVDVTTGLVGETQTEITTGLSGGEQLVTRGQTYLSDGALVRIVEG